MSIYKNFEDLSLNELFKVYFAASDKDRRPTGGFFNRISYG